MRVKARKENARKNDIQRVSLFVFSSVANKGHDSMRTCNLPVLVRVLSRLESRARKEAKEYWLDVVPPPFSFRSILTIGVCVCDDDSSIWVYGSMRFMSFVFSPSKSVMEKRRKV